MPVPVFVVFAAAREALGASVASAAQELGVSASYLWDLEQFVKVYSPWEGAPSDFPFPNKVAEYFRTAGASLGEAGGELRHTVLSLAAPPLVEAALERDYAFHHSFLPHLAYVYVSPSGLYSRFFRAWTSWISSPPPEEEASGRHRVLRHRDPSVAHFSDYVWERAWGRSDKRRRRGEDPALYSVRYERAAGDVAAIGFLSHEPVMALAAGRPWRPAWLGVFAPLLLYISARGFCLEFSDGQGEMYFELAGYEADMRWRVSLAYPHRYSLEAVEGELPDRERALTIRHSGS